MHEYMFQVWNFSGVHQSDVILRCEISVCYFLFHFGPFMWKQLLWLDMEKFLLSVETPYTTEFISSYYILWTPLFDLICGQLNDFIYHG